MPTITRTFEFDYGHRVLNHESKCRHIHGHRAKAEVTVSAPGLDPLGRVIDFGVLKQLVGGWVDENWDHNVLLNAADPLLSIYGDLPYPALQEAMFAGKEPYVMRYGNPTAEVIARELFEQCEKLLPGHLTVVRVRVWETPSCFADYSREDVQC